MHLIAFVTSLEASSRDHGPASCNFWELSSYSFARTDTKLDVPWPSLPLNSASKTDKVILTYAASTGASSFAVQLAKLAGYTVIASCSPHKVELVKSYGADTV